MGSGGKNVIRSLVTLAAGCRLYGLWRKPVPAYAAVAFVEFDQKRTDIDNTGTARGGA